MNSSRCVCVCVYVYLCVCVAVSEIHFTFTVLNPSVCCTSAVCCLLQKINDAKCNHESHKPHDETRRPHYPYAVLERHETSDTSASETSSFEHQFQFATFSRYGGLREAKSVLGQLRAAIERLDLSLTHQRVILIMSNYCDVMRTQNQTIFRGVLRVRIHTEAI